MQQGGTSCQQAESFDVQDGEGQALVEAILHLEKLEEGYFRGVTIKEGNLYPRVFGGQLLGQALLAAYRTVEPSLCAHSLHSYFLLAGDPQVPIIYRVDHIRDGKSFATRLVVAIQKGRNIFSLVASFQRPEEGFDHQYTAPAAPPPEEVITWEQLTSRFMHDPRLTAAQRARYHRQAEARAREPGPIDMRFVNPVDRIQPTKKEPTQLIWLKSRGQLAGGTAMQQAVAAYASDFSFLETALLPHGYVIPDPRLIVASLDHSMWFHRPFRTDEWLLYHVASPRSSGSRGFCLGRMYTQAGELVVSVAQEGLIRLNAKYRESLEEDQQPKAPQEVPNPASHDVSQPLTTSRL